MRRASVIKVAVVVVGLLAVTGGTLAMKARQSKADAPAAPAFEPSEATEIIPAREVTWQPTADLVGTVFAIRSVAARNELAGVVRQVGFESGDIVEQGQILIQLDDRSERADLDAANAAVRVAQANITTADSQIALAEAELGRLGSVQSRAVAEMDLDRARTRRDTAKADRGRWVAEVDQAKAKVAQIESQLAKHTLRAPFRARAGLRNVHEGQYLAEGADIVALEEVTDNVYLDFAVPQEYAARAKAGTTVLATAELLGPDPVKITVVAVDATVNTDTRNLRIRALVDNRRGTLVPGMSVQVRVPIDEPKKLVVVPSTAVRRAAYGNSVFVILPDEATKDLRAYQRFVTLGQTLGEDVMVTEGLKPGEQIAGAGSFKLRDKAKVMPQAAPAAPAGQSPAPGGG